jgi:hypothetical protein
VKDILRDTPAPHPPPPPLPLSFETKSVGHGSFIRRLFSSLFGEDRSEPGVDPDAQAAESAPVDPIEPGAPAPTTREGGEQRPHHRRGRPARGGGPRRGHPRPPHRASEVVEGDAGAPLPSARDEETASETTTAALPPEDRPRRPRSEALRGPRAAVDGAVAGAVAVAGRGRMPRAVIRASRRGPPRPDRKAIPWHHFHPRSRSPAIMTKASPTRAPRARRMTPGPRDRPTPRRLVHRRMIGRRSGPDLRGDRASLDPTDVARRITCR